ncbi:ABC transporter permease [Alkalinema sp. FACHB-956]|uniref:cell division protein FtsX n=1 Tax=Alkalinema sp. FACHB-956 TaxID=2692768 RepID=UPI0016876833|nr:ABC transporter permease [Alkalinema sp. FACHB-956]MBD2328265.1 ABC transporter permease [Alkalinema sp. FACHB-956]
MLRSLTKLDYILRETWLGLRRGGWMNWAAISTVTVLLFLFGLSLQTSWQVGQFLNQFGNQLEVTAFLETGIAAKDIQPIVQKLPDVSKVETIGKEQAWADLVKELGMTDLQGATQQLSGNPLVDELRVQAKSAPTVATVAAALKQVKGVETVQYAGEAVKQVADLNRGLGWINLGVTGFLTISAIAVITTTLRLVIAARRQEIEVMRLVGATRAWIYLPFMLQGVAFGLVGAATAWILIHGLQRSLTQFLVQQGDLLQSLLLQNTPWQVWLLPVILLGFGSTIGVLGSLLAVRNLGLRS